VLWEELVGYLNSGVGANWTGSYLQLRMKVPGLIHLVSGAADYAFV
jgi:hypothetical protein